MLDDITERAFGVLKKWLYAQKLARPKTLRDKYKLRVRFIKGIGPDEDCPEEPIYGHVPLEEFDEKAMAISQGALDFDGINERRIIYLRGRFEAFDYTTPKFWHWDDLVDVYIMADKYDFPHLRDDIVKQWQYQATNFTSHCTIETVAHAFENLPEKSHLLSLMVDHWALLWKPQPRDSKAIQTKAPSSFLARLSLAQAAHKGLRFAEMQPGFRRLPCSQHEHLGEDKPCTGFEKYSYSKTMPDSGVWRNIIFPEEHSEDEGDGDEDEDEDADDDEDADEADDEAMVIE